MWCVHVFLTWMLILNGRFPKGYRCKNKKARHVTMIIYHLSCNQKWILLTTKHFFGGDDDDKTTIQNYILFKKRRSKNLSTIVQTPLQSAGWQMVRLSTCNRNTVCRFVLFVCWTQWNRRHLLAISHFCNNLQAHFFKLRCRCWFVDRGSLSLCRFGFVQTCCVCSLRWGVLPSPFSSLFQRKVSMPGCG